MNNITAFVILLLILIVFFVTMTMTNSKKDHFNAVDINDYIYNVIDNDKEYTQSVKYYFDALKAANNENKDLDTLDAYYALLAQAKIRKLTPDFIANYKHHN